MRLQVLNASDQDATGDAVMNDAADESQIEEISTGGALADPMQQVKIAFSNFHFRKVAFSKVHAVLVLNFEKLRFRTFVPV